ncbi:MAG: hypothetical protein QOI35_1435 [Cryptosporangiaceae bacterium]|nr:hypothetical protein [Cryptosporangiaceae bacterium]
MGAARRATRLNRLLGLASAGLGAAELARPDAVARLTGLDGHPARDLIPAMGARELAHAAGLLPRRQPTRWIWTRVAGDLLDLAVLSTALRDRKGSQRRRALAATAVVAGITATDLYAALLTTSARRSERRSHQRFAASVTVPAAPAEAYRYWRNFENLPTFMTHLESVRTTAGNRSHWTAKAPAGGSVSWDAEITGDKPGELIGWRSLPGAQVPNAGSVRFRPTHGGRETEVRVELAWDPPGGKAGSAVAALFGENPQQQVHDDLRRFQQVVAADKLGAGRATGPLGD